MKIRKIVVSAFAILLVISIFAFSLFNSITSDVEKNSFAMGSPVTIKVYGEKDGEAFCDSAIERIKFVDNTYLSHTISSSAVYVLNKDGKLTADKWFGHYLTKCAELSAKSDSFTLFSGELKDLWKIENGGNVPTDDEIAKSLQNIREASINIEKNTITHNVTVNNGILDLGALGKGTACDEAIDYLKTHNVEKALVTVGGSIGAIGKDPYKIGVRNPFGGQNDYFAILNVTNCFVSTSGDYEKYFEKDGVRYSHIFDATTGKPVQSDITSVTVLADNGTLSDFLSTAVFIEGVEKGFELAKEFDAEVIIIKKDKSVLISKGVENKITINDDSFSVSVIE